MHKMKVGTPLDVRVVELEELLRVEEEKAGMY